MKIDNGVKSLGYFPDGDPRNIQILTQTIRRKLGSKEDLTLDDLQVIFDDIIRVLRDCPHPIFDHDIRNSLYNIVYYKHLVEANFASNPNEEEKYFQTVLGLLFLISDIGKCLDYYAEPYFKNGKPDPDQIKKGLYPFKRTRRRIRSVIYSLADRYANCEIKFNLDYERDFEEGIELDIPLHFVSRFLISSLNNAADPRRGGATEIIVSLDLNPDFLALKITDNGSGIPIDILKENEEGRRPLFQKGITTVEQGKGLGLHDMDLIFAHAGIGLDVQTSGDGTVFELKLPLADRQITTVEVLTRFKSSIELQENSQLIELIVNNPRAFVSPGTPHLCSGAVLKTEFVEAYIKKLLQGDDNDITKANKLREILDAEPVENSLTKKQRLPHPPTFQTTEFLYPEFLEFILKKVIDSSDEDAEPIILPPKRTKDEWFEMLISISQMSTAQIGSEFNTLDISNEEMSQLLNFFEKLTQERLRSLDLGALSVGDLATNVCYATGERIRLIQVLKQTQ